MQGRGIRQDRLWLLAGTGEGPPLAAALARIGWRVTVSVVTPAAASAYAGLDLEGIRVGALAGVEAIRSELLDGDPYRWVVDATHPFAVRISTDLQRACEALKQPLLRLERPTEQGGQVQWLHALGDLRKLELHGQRLFLAIGGRHLSVASHAAREAGAEVFARCLPSADGLRPALAAGLPGGQLAVLRPLQGSMPGAIERALCRRWRVSCVFCRQSGGVTEQLWRRLSMELDLQLLLLRRPCPPQGVEIVRSETLLMQRVTTPVPPF